MKKHLLILMLFAGMFSACDSVKPGAGKISEGKITYKIDLSNTEMDLMKKAMAEAAKLNISFKGEQIRIEYGMGGMGMTYVMDAGTKTGLVLVSVLGNKTASKINTENFDARRKEKDNYTVEYVDESKEIAGYKCKKAVLKSDKGAELTLFYAEDIQPAKVNTEFTFEGIKGFPLEMQVSMNGLNVTMVASTVDVTPFPADYFNTEIPEGYVEKDLSPFMKK